MKEQYFIAGTSDLSEHFFAQHLRQIEKKTKPKAAMKSLSLQDQILKRMNIQAEKLDIIQWLAKVNDSRIIKQFMLLKRSNEEAFVNLSQQEKEAIDKGMQSISEGRSKSHEEVTEATRKKYGHLFKS